MTGEPARNALGGLGAAVADLLMQSLGLSAWGVALLMLVFGVVGYLMRKLNYPMAPAVLAIVLGPLAEPALRQSLLISSGSFSIFFTRPFAAVFMVIAVTLLLLPVVSLFRRRLAGGR